MKVVHDINKTGLDTNKQIYQCKTCGKLFNWDGNSSWYGSYKQMENQPDKIKYFCSDKCVRIQQAYYLQHKHIDYSKH